MSCEIVNGDQVTEWRRHLKLSQKNLSTELGLTRNTVSNWERGAVEPPPWLHLWFIGFKYRKQVTRKAKRFHPPEVKGQIVAAYKAGEKAEVIAALYGCHPKYPGKLVKQLGLPRRVPGKHKRS